MLLFTGRRPLCRCHAVLAIVISDIPRVHWTFAFWAGHGCAVGLCYILRLGSRRNECKLHSPDERERHHGQNCQRDPERLSCHVNLPFDLAYCAIGWSLGKVWLLLDLTSAAVNIRGRQHSSYLNIFASNHGCAEPSGQACPNSGFSKLCALRWPLPAGRHARRELRIGPIRSGGSIFRLLFDLANRRNL